MNRKIINTHSKFWAAWRLDRAL